MPVKINKIPYTQQELQEMFHGEDPQQVIDHINRNRRDNRIENLRDISFRKNAQNQQKVGHFLGVQKRSDCNRYRARIFMNGRKKSLGLYMTAEEANIAVLEAKANYGID